jgi:formylglycine-generating enzyme required for sulfatase activity
MGCSQADEEPREPTATEGPPYPFRGLTRCQDDEQPVHVVTISRGYWMGQSEVTRDAYKEFARATGNPLPPEQNIPGVKLNPAGNDPIGAVTWEEAAGYCAWAGLRLPTEAEWEYAATQRLYTGSGPKPNRKTFSIVLDLHDLMGRMWEWTGDWYGKNYYVIADRIDPRGPAEGERRVMRGGSDGLNPGGARISRRGHDTPGARGRGNGFRCAGQIP